MTHEQGLFERLMPDIKNATWYRQRFDACPHFMFFLGDAHISEIQHTKYPFGQRVAYAGFSKNRADWYHSIPELEYTAEHVIAASRENPDVSKDMIAEFKPHADAFYALCEKVRGMDLTSLSNDGLVALYNELADVYTKKLNASPLIDGFALATDKLIAEKIRTHLESRGEEDRFVSVFSVLTAPPFLSFLQEEEIALLRLVQSGKEKAAAIVEHQQKYFWMRNNYVKDHVLEEGFFAERFDHATQEDVAAKIAQISSGPEEHARAKAVLMDELELPQDIRTLLTITDDFNAWQDERKKGTFFATHYFSVLLEEFVRRTSYTVEELKYAFPPEMGKVLAGELSREELQQRFQYCMIVWVKDAYDVTTDQELIEKLDAIGTGATHQGEELKGFAAQLGVVRGKVKVLMSAEEVHKIEEGDVLVSVMTRPDYVPAMKKAAAFVTDEGGITCHAAIVAREMKKPCIIGTKIATKLLKDGDEVEVDADHGIVRVVERAV